MSLNEMRLANILFESEDKYVHLVNEAVLNEAVEDVQGYIETLDMLKNGLVGHANIKTMIEELHDELSNVADEKSGRLNQIFGKRKKFATATENLKTQIWDLYKKLALSSPLKAQFEASKRKLASKQLAIQVEVGRTGAPAPTGASHPVTWSQINNWINAAFPSLSSADKQTLANALLAAEIAALKPGTILPERKITISSLLFEDSLPDLQPNDADFSAKFKAEFEKQFAKFSPNLKNSLGNYQTKLDDYISTAKQRKLDDSDGLEGSKENKPTQTSNLANALAQNNNPQDVITKALDFISNNLPQLQATGETEVKTKDEAEKIKQNLLSIASLPAEDSSKKDDAVKALPQLGSNNSLNNAIAKAIGVQPTQDSGDDQSLKDETEQNNEKATGENDSGDANKGEDAGQQSNLGDEKTQYGGPGDEKKTKEKIDSFIKDEIYPIFENISLRSNPLIYLNKVFDFVDNNFDELKRNGLTSFADKQSLNSNKTMLTQKINSLTKYDRKEAEDIATLFPSLGLGPKLRKYLIKTIEDKFYNDANDKNAEGQNQGANRSSQAPPATEESPNFEKEKNATFNTMYGLLRGDAIGRRSFNQVKTKLDRMLETLNRKFNKNLTFDDFMSYLEAKGDVNDVIQKIKNNVANPDQVMSENLRRIIIKEMYNLNLKRLFEDDFKFSKFDRLDKDDDADEIDPETGYVAVKNTKSHKPASKNDFKLNPKASLKFSKSIPDDVLEEAAGSSPAVSISPKKKFVNFKIEDFNDLEIEPVGSDLLIAYENTGSDEEEYDFSVLGIQGIDKISIPKDVDTFYIVGSDNSNKPAALPDRFSSESGSKTPDKTLNDLDTGLAKTKTTIDKSQSAINDLVAKKAGLTNIGSSGLQTDFARLKMLQFTSNYKLLEKMMTSPLPGVSGGSSGAGAAAIGAAAVGAAAAGLAGVGGAAGGSSGAGVGGSAGGGAGRGTARHSLKNAIGGLKTKDGKKLEDVIDIVPLKNTINSLLGSEFFTESVSYDQNRLEVLAGIRKK